MQKALKHYYSYGPSASLFKDDFEQILEVLRESCGETEISDGDYLYESLQELQEKKGDVVRRLSLSGIHPHVLVTIKRYDFPGLQLLAIGQNGAAEAAYLKIKQILHGRRKAIGYIFNPFLWIFILFVSIFTSPYGGKALFAAPPVSVFFVVLSAWIYMGGLSTVTLLSRHQSRSFWTRNKDTLLIGLLSAIVGAVIGSLATWFLAVHSPF